MLIFEQWVAAILVVVASVLGIALTVVTLPGAWLAVAVGAGVCLWRPELMSWWAVGGAAGLALLAEVVEFGASAVGAAKGGGGKAGAIGSIIGSLLGAILGAALFFVVGAIVGGVVGAALGALIAERGIAKKTWEESAKVGWGAAVGRFLATVFKTLFAAAIALVLTITLAVHVARLV